jgi:ankyrin repeat protein
MGVMEPDDPLAVAATTAIRDGDAETLAALLREHPDLATARVGSADESRSWLHVATDWPGQFPNTAATIAALVAAGADVNARFVGAHAETALHWAASNDDVVAIDALLDAGADIEARGAVIAGGTPLDDAVAFGQWSAACCLVERGAHTALCHAAALGRLDDLAAMLGAETDDPGVGQDDIDNAFWYACHGGQVVAARLLLARGADVNRIGWDGKAPLDVALECTASRAVDIASWVRDQGGRSAKDSG